MELCLISACYERVLWQMNVIGTEEMGEGRMSFWLIYKIYSKVLIISEVHTQQNQCLNVKMGLSTR